MGRVILLWASASCLALAACGSDVQESAATGGLGGAAIGALAGGPVGAAIGLGAGAAAGTGVEKGQEQGVIPPEPGDRPAHRTPVAANDDVRHAQLALRDQGLYDGPVDGIAGPRTRHALTEYQRRQGLPQTARLDRDTRDALSNEVAAVPAERRR
jgi:peptidoglycan hydrolase-like protein with peptidoglycan-binding domain